MTLQREKRRSCESCRTRKLRCSGHDTAGLGCTRCRSLSLTCHFREQGAPGRPRKPRASVPGSNTSIRQAQGEQSSQLSPPSTDEGPDCGEQQNSPSVNDTAMRGASCGLDQENFSKLLLGFPTSCPAGFNASVASASQPMCSHGCAHNDQGDDLQGPLPTDQNNQMHNGTVNGLFTFQEAERLVSPRCNCAQDVFMTLRSLKTTPSSHALVQVTRRGTDLVASLLTCPICYDLTQPPRVTIQNVLLVGRLIYGITTAYRRYVRWFKESSSSLHGGQAAEKSETVYLHSPGSQTMDQGLGLTVSASTLRDLLLQGLQADAQRLSALGRQFALRQLNRHIIGHEACPTADGGCWKEECENDADLDPLDICPLHPAARVLTPCFRIVDVSEAMIKQVAEAIT